MWRRQLVDQWLRVRDPARAEKQRAAAAAADADPALEILRRLNGAFGAGELAIAEHERLVALFLDGDLDEVATELEQLLDKEA